MDRSHSSTYTVYLAGVTGASIKHLFIVKYLTGTWHCFPYPLFMAQIERFHMTSWRPYAWVFQNNKTAAILMFQTNPVGVELFSYVNAFFCSHKFS